MGPQSGQGSRQRPPAGRAKGKRASTGDSSSERTSGASQAGPDLPLRIGVLADTHGYLNPAIEELFAGVSHIIHAGDIMDPAILATLAGIAPLTAVAGNLDTGELAASLPREVLVEAAGITFAVGHKRKRLLKRLSSGKFLSEVSKSSLRLVVFGHEHVPSASWVEGVLYLNPGTASAPEEEDDAATVAIVSLAPAGLSVTFVPLPRAPMPPAEL
jgi:putative phosphoesterase